jgi:hypothetical protein
MCRVRTLRAPIRFCAIVDAFAEHTPFALIASDAEAWRLQRFDGHKNLGREPAAGCLEQRGADGEATPQILRTER